MILPPRLCILLAFGWNEKEGRKEGRRGEKGRRVWSLSSSRDTIIVAPLHRLMVFQLFSLNEFPPSPPGMNSGTRERRRRRFVVDRSPSELMLSGHHKFCVKNFFSLRLDYSCYSILSSMNFLHEFSSSRLYVPNRGDWVYDHEREKYNLISFVISFLKFVYARYTNEGVYYIRKWNELGLTFSHSPSNVFKLTRIVY